MKEPDTTTVMGGSRSVTPATSTMVMAELDQHRAGPFTSGTTPVPSSVPVPMGSILRDATGDSATQNVPPALSSSGTATAAAAPVSSKPLASPITPATNPNGASSTTAEPVFAPPLAAIEMPTEAAEELRRVAEAYRNFDASMSPVHVPVTGVRRQMTKKEADSLNGTAPPKNSEVLNQAKERGGSDANGIRVFCDRFTSTDLVGSVKRQARICFGSAALTDAAQPPELKFSWILAASEDMYGRANHLGNEVSAETEDDRSAALAAPEKSPAKAPAHAQAAREAEAAQRAERDAEVAAVLTALAYAGAAPEAVRAKVAAVDKEKREDAASKRRKVSTG